MNLIGTANVTDLGVFQVARLRRVLWHRATCDDPKLGLLLDRAIVSLYRACVAAGAAANAKQPLGDYRAARARLAFGRLKNGRHPSIASRAEVDSTD